MEKGHRMAEISETSETEANYGSAPGIPNMDGDMAKGGGASGALGGATRDDGNTGATPGRTAGNEGGANDPLSMDGATLAGTSRR